MTERNVADPHCRVHELQYRVAGQTLSDKRRRWRGVYPIARSIESLICVSSRAACGRRVRRLPSSHAVPPAVPRAFAVHRTLLLIYLLNHLPLSEEERRAAGPRSSSRAVPLPFPSAIKAGRRGGGGGFYRRARKRYLWIMGHASFAPCRPLARRVFTARYSTVQSTCERNYRLYTDRRACS